MRYTTHLLLSQLSQDMKPQRRRRDPFGNDSPSCFCWMLSGDRWLAGPLLASISKSESRCRPKRRCPPGWPSLLSKHLGSITCKRDFTW